MKANTDYYRVTSKRNNWIGRVIKVNDYSFDAETISGKNSNKGECYICLNFEMFVIVEYESIHIYRKGNEVKAILKNGKETVKEAIAKCSPDDEFVFETGARLAIDRLFEKPLLEKFETDKCYKFSLDQYVKIYGYCVPSWVKKIEGKRVNVLNPSRARCDNYFVSPRWCEEIEETERKIEIGDVVEVVNSGASFSTYTKWFAETGYSELKNHYVPNSSATNCMTLKVVGKGKHRATQEMVYAVQNPATTQVFLIGERGIKLVD